MKNAPFIDWVTARQSHYGPEPLPLFLQGVSSYHTADGVCVFEKARAIRFGGSWDSSIQLQSDGASFLMSGNVGRFGRPDNLFNYRWRDTVNAMERVCDALSVPRFRNGGHLGVVDAAGQVHHGAAISRVDVTKNYRTGSDAQARVLIRHLQTLRVSRMKRDHDEDHGVWWSNQRKMVKAYVKGVDLMTAHGTVAGRPRDDKLVQYCFDNGIVRVEVELKNRYLYDAELQSIDAITDEKLSAIYDEETAFMDSGLTSDEPDILASLPSRVRVYADAWFKGADLSYVSRATLYRLRRELMPFGIDVFQPRNIEQFPTRVRLIEMEEVEAPEWYEWERKA